MPSTLSRDERSSSSNTRPHNPGGAALTLAWITAAIGAYVALHTLWMVIICWSPLPFGDQWSEIVTGRPLTLSWLVSQHLEHRILVPRLVFLADRWLAGETNRINYAVNFAMQCGLAVLIYVISRGAGVRGAAARIWAAGFCSALLLWAGQYQNFVWGFQVQFFGVVLAASGVFAVLALRPATLSTLALVTLLEAIAAYTLASGVLAGFLAVGLALALGRPWRFTCALAGASLLILASYLVHYHTPPESSDPFAAWHHAGGIAVYLLAALGAPVANLVLLHAPLGVGFMVCVGAGLLGCYVFARIFWGMWRARAEINPHQSALMAIAAFVLCMLLITAAGRYVKGLESAFVSRYTTPAVTFWCCLVLVLAARTGRMSGVVTAWAFPLVLLTGLTESGNVAIARDWVTLRSATEPAFLAGVADIELLRKIYAVEPGAPLEGSPAERWGPLLRSAKTSVFAEAWADWLGTRLSQHVTKLDSKSCEGANAPVLQVQKTPGPGWRATGWARATESGDAVKRLVFVDQSGLIVGFAVGGLDLTRIGLPALGTPHPAGTDWIGDFAAASPGGVSTIALISEGKMGCKMAAR